MNNHNFVLSIIKSEQTPEGFPYTIPSIFQLKELRFDKPVTFFVGENGSGKSTLLEAIAVNLGLNAEGGSRNFNFRTTESHSQLYENLKIIRGHKRPKDSYFLKAESFYNVATMKSKTIYLNIMAIKAFIPSRMRSLS